MLPESASIQTQLLAWFQRACSRPWIRQAVKMTLDAALAGVAWAAAFGLMRVDLPGLRSMLAWMAFAMIVNLAFQHTRQHYRLMGFMELRSLILSMAALVLVPPIGHGLGRPIGARPVPWMCSSASSATRSRTIRTIPPMSGPPGAPATSAAEGWGGTFAPPRHAA